MSDTIYAVTGATGHIGRRISEALLAQGKKVRVIGRDAARLKPLAEKGAQPFAGSLEDAAFVSKAFEGAKAVFAMIPPNMTAPDIRAFQRKISENLAAAVVKNGVTHIITLSSVGAQLSEGTGPIAGLHENEERFNALPNVNVVHLRPTFFMENSLMNIGLIKSMGINGSPMRADLTISMIHTNDIAAAAIRFLADLKFSGKQAKELLGPKDTTMAETTAALGQAIGRPDLKYVQFPYEDARKAMVGMGLSPSVADGYVAMYQAFNEGLIKPEVKRNPDSTTPTLFEEFAKEFAEAYNKN